MVVRRNLPIATDARVRERGKNGRFGTVIKTIGAKKWMVRFDGESKDVEKTSAQLSRVRVDNANDESPSDPAPPKFIAPTSRRSARGKQKEGEEKEGKEEEAIAQAASTTRSPASKEVTAVNDKSSSEGSGDDSSQETWNDDSGVGSGPPCNDPPSEEDGADDDLDSFQVSNDEEDSDNEDSESPIISNDDGSDDAANREELDDPVEGVVFLADEEEDDFASVNPFASSTDFEEITDENSKQKHEEKTKRYLQEKEKHILNKKTFVMKPNRTAKVAVGDKVKMKDSNKIGSTIERINKQKWKIQLELGGSPIECKSTDFEVIDTGDSIKWTVVANPGPPSEAPTEYEAVGLLDFDFDAFRESKIAVQVGKGYEFPFGELVKKLWPGDARKHRANMNDFLQAENRRYEQECKGGTRKKKRKHKLISEHEFWKFIGILIAASACGKKGAKLWEKETSRSHQTFSKPTDLGPTGRDTIPAYRFAEMKKAFAHAFHDKSNPEDPWAQVRLLIDGFNANRKQTLAASILKVLDESMSAFRPRTSATSELPNISFILRKPEPLGTEFKIVCCGVTGCMIRLEVQEGKDAMRQKSYSKELGATAGCTARLIEGCSYCGDSDDRCQAKEDKKPLLVYGDSWFGSKTTSLWLKKNLGHESVFAVKTNHSGLPKAEMENLMKDYPSGADIVTKATIDGVVLYFVGYKYNSRKVLFFLCTENAGSLQKGEPYVARFPDSHGNVKTREVDRPAAISNYFANSNVVDRHNHLRQFELRLEKMWVTPNPWFRICTTAVGMTVTDAFLLARHQAANPKFKKMTIVEFSDCVAHDLIYNQIPDHQESAFVSSSSASSRPPPVDTRRQEGNSLLGRMISAMSSPRASLGSLSSLSPSGSESSSSRRSPMKSVLGVFSKMVRSHKLEDNPEKLDSGYPRRRRCMKCGKLTQKMCTHPACKMRATNSRNGVTYGSFFCKGECWDSHLEDVEKIVLGSD